MADKGPETFLSKHRHPLLFGAWLLLTGAAFLRVSRQPYHSRLKTEQYETIFKGTSLAAVLAAIGLGGGLNRPRSETVAGEVETILRAVISVRDLPNWPSQCRAKKKR
ncbi:hypothetical protein SLS58_005980 [Diplodia intermedia]|uniref:Uncharacterized protein n=1 Tax=Diplodia intermedia TaxID=856260 RepID=A0ABR3TP93_9PEZI